MIKVLHFLNTNTFSGAENVAITIIKNMNECNNFKCIYIAIEGPIKKVLEEQSVPYILVKELSRKSIKDLIGAEKPDIIHCHDFTTSILVASVCNSRFPIISHLHNNPLWIKKFCLKSLVYGLSLKKYSVVLAVSQAVFNEFIFSNNIKNKQVVGNPLSISCVKDSVEENACLDCQYDLIFLGRLCEQKNPIRFINIVNQLKYYKSSIKTVMLGDGELRQKCEDYIKKMNLEDNIKVLGFKEERFDYLYKSKVLCMTSEWEGFGLVAFEALSLSKPVVCTGVGGLSGIVDEKCGKICNTDEEFVKEIFQLLRDDDYYTIKSAGAYNRANELDNLSDYINQLKQIYDVVMQ